MKCIHNLKLLQCLPCRNNSDCIHYNTHNGPRGIIKRKDCLACRALYCDICKRCVVYDFIGRHNQGYNHQNKLKSLGGFSKTAITNIAL